MMGEIWKAIPAHPRYEVSDAGNVRNARTGYVLRIRFHRGYGRVDLRERTREVHGLVLEAFAGPRPAGMDEIRHLDGNKANNSIGNLAYGTRAENAQDRIAHGTQYRHEKGLVFLGATNPNSRLDDDAVRLVRRLAKLGESGRAIASKMNVAPTTIHRIISGVTWGHVR